MVRVLLGLLGIAAVAGVMVFGFGLGTGKSDGIDYRLVKVDRGRIVNTVSASGKLRPVTTVQVGSQISGRISQLLADFNTAVKADQVVARIDPASFEAKVAEARADLAVAKANVAMQKANVGAMEADIKGARAALAEADQNLVRRRQLFTRRIIAESEIEKAVSARDQARSKLDSAIAKLATQRAQFANAEAQVLAKAATLRQRELDLEHTIIRSPVDGVVISRNVDIGQTVAASLQAPILFQIAQDLREMEVEVSVDEADIGRVAEGQPATFTVDAFPSREFVGRVRQIRKAPVEVSNVVTYAVVLTTDNSDQTLLPGMTANVAIKTGERADVLRMANAALRYRPSSEPAKSSFPPGSAAAASGTGAGGRGRAEEQVQWLTENLSLTPDQQQAVRAVFAEIGRKMQSMRAEGASPQDIRSAREQARVANRARIEAVLSEEQRKRYREMRAARSGESRRTQVWRIGKNGKPEAVAVIVGLSDATMTELRSGELKDGDQVIVGETKAAASTPRAFRLGF